MVIWKVASSFTVSGRTSESDNAWFVAVVVLVAVVPLGLVSHGEPRFVFFPVWLLVAVGSALAVSLLMSMR